MGIQVFNKEEIMANGSSFLKKLVKWNLFLIKLAKNGGPKKQAILQNEDPESI